MNEEEIKAIEYINKMLEYPKLYAHTGNESDFLRGIDKKQIETVLNMINEYEVACNCGKQEIETLNFTIRKLQKDIIKQQAKIDELNFDKDILTDTVNKQLEVIEKQKTEIEELKATELKAKNGTIKVTLEGLLHLENEIKEKDKIIDNLVDNLRYYNGMQQDDIFCNQICSNKENCDRENCYYRIKEYFENKVKESK